MIKKTKTFADKVRDVVSKIPKGKVLEMGNG
jgi:alkylated DNA nucleotide flippase Atl1